MIPCMTFTPLYSTRAHGEFWDIFEREVWAGGHLCARVRVDSQNVHGFDALL